MSTPNYIRNIRRRRAMPLWLAFPALCVCAYLLGWVMSHV